MHMVIHSLVEASTEDDALATGKTVFDRLVGAVPHAGAVFDYYVTFDDDETTVAGSARWDDLPVAAPVDSDEGEELLDRGWEATKEEFERNLDRVKEAIDEFSDEAIMRDEDLARHAFHKVGAYDGPTIFLYTEHGTGIRHRGQLDRLVEEIIERLESGDPSREEGERLFEEGRQTLDEIREILDRGEGEVVELPE